MENADYNFNILLFPQRQKKFIIDILRILAISIVCSQYSMNIFFIELNTG